MNVTIRQLQCFVAVARARSFAEAGALLHLSQPALSIAIRNLEEAVGGKLLERSTRAVALTPEGAHFLGVVQRLLGDWERSLEDVRNLFALRRGKLDIAAIPTFASSLLPQILADYHRQFPDINITVHDVITESVVEMVRAGRAELGVTFDPGDAQDLHFAPLFRDRFVAVLPAVHVERVANLLLALEQLIAGQQPDEAALYQVFEAYGGRYEPEMETAVLPS